MTMQALIDVPIGKGARVAHVSTQLGLCTHLREMESDKNPGIHCVNKGCGSVICEVCNARVGLARWSSSIFTIKVK